MKPSGDKTPWWAELAHVVREGPTTLPVWSAWGENTQRGVVDDMRLIIEPASNLELVKHRDNDGRNPRKAGTITVDAYAWNPQDNQMWGVRYDGRWYDAFQGRELIRDGAQFEVAENSKQYEWTYRGWPPPDNRSLTSRANLGEHVQDALSPEGTKILSVRLPAGLADSLRVSADAQGVTLSEYTRALIEKALLEE